jgi:AcrR family transcriptional regulator
VAEAAGVSNQTVVNLFHGVQGVAAATFAEHATDVREVADSTADQDPLLALHQVLVRLAECVAMDPEPARALLAERVAAALHQGGELSDMDIRLEVPLADSVMLALSRLDVGDTEPIEIATVLINFVLSHAIGRSGQEFETARLALRLLPDSSTGTHWSHPIGPDRRVAPDRRATRHDGRSPEPGWQLTDPTGPY